MDYNNTNANPNVTNLVNLLAATSLAGRILECLRFADIQRLCVCCKDSKKALQRGKAPCIDAVITWLKDTEVLRCLSCPTPLLRKISRSIRRYPLRYRLVSYCEGGGFLTNDQRITLFEAFDRAWDYSIISIPPDESPFRFATVSALTLEESCEIFEGGAYDVISDIGEDVADEEDKERKKVGEKGSSDSGHDDANRCINVNASETDSDSRIHKKPRKLVCSSTYCQNDGREKCHRLYYVGVNPYCGTCLDSFNYLKLMFSAEHITAKNTDWSIRELSYNEEPCRRPTQAEWGLADDEFWVRLFYTQPYNYGEMRFMGVGSRG